MIPSHLLGVFFALTSAVVWGTGDFSGGVATRRTNQYQVLAYATLSGLVIMLLGMLLLGETLPSLKGSLWSMAAGVSGALGIVALYRGLSLGRIVLVAPMAAVIGAALPVVFSAFTAGLPSVTQLLGFATGLLGIWFTSREPVGPSRISREEILLSVAAGFGFGGFFILIALGAESGLFAPLAIAKGAALLLALSILMLRGEGLPSLGGNLIALLAGVFDAGGNWFFLLAEQFTRIDIAAVLSSMYPVMTVFLAHLMLKENVSPLHWTGVGLCILAIALISF